MIKNHCFPRPFRRRTGRVLLVRDHNGQPLAYVYFEDEPGRRSAAKLLTRDEAAADRGEHRQAAGATSKEPNQRPPIRQADRVLEPISTGLAGPDVPNTIIGQMLGPFRRNDIRTALRALISKSSIHDASSSPF